jgi:tetratricopeptide (TPR) repeat protein
LALFGRKKTDEVVPPNPGAGGNGTGKPPAAATAGAGSGAGFDPDKAKRFFEHARTMHDSTQYEYAMSLWLQGLRLDPHNTAATESFLRSGQEFVNSPAGKKGVSKDTMRLFSERSDVNRYLMSLLEWSVRLTDPVAAVRAAEAGAKLSLAEPAYRIGEMAQNAVLREKKPRKDLLVKLMEVFSNIGAFEKAVEAGEAAKIIDPTDGALAAMVRNLSAQQTMSRGGYDQTGQAGGFKANIRDLDKQRKMDEGDRISRTEEATDRLVREAGADYKQNPEDINALRIYAQRLKERGRPEDEEEAFKLLDKAFARTKQFMFRKMAGEIRIRRALRQLSQRKEAAAANPQDAAAAEAYANAKAKFLAMEIEEFQAQLEAYPTDLTIKFELGKRLFDSGKFEDAIPLFQESQNDVKNKVASMAYLAKAFLSIGFLDGAVQTYRQALEGYKTPDDETGMDLRYGLVAALKAHAESERSVKDAEEADKLASAIAIRQFNYRDIRVLREQLKKLITELRA